MPPSPQSPLPFDAACRILSGYGTGAGFLLTHDGLVASCAHGVYDGQEVRVEVVGGRLYDARVVSRQPRRDLALLKIEGVAGLPSVRLGDPRERTPGERFFIVTFDQLPESSLAPIYLPEGSREGRIVGPLALDVGFAGMLHVYAQGDDPGFDCALTTRTAQVRPGSSGAMVCAPDGSVVGVHVAALELGGFGQEISAVELASLVQDHWHRPSDATPPDATPLGAPPDAGASERWERVLYALQCLELDRRDVDREPQSHRRDLERLGDEPTRDAEIRLAQMTAHKALEAWPEAIACSLDAIRLGGISACWSLRGLAQRGDAEAIAGFLAERVEGMPELKRRVALREALLGVLNDAGRFEEAANWAEASEADAREHDDSATLRLECARAYHGLGDQSEAESWLLRAAWARDAKDLKKSEIARIASNSTDLRTRWYGFRQGFSALASGEGNAAVVGSLQRLVGGEDATEAARFFGSLARAFSDRAKEGR